MYLYMYVPTKLWYKGNKINIVLSMTGARHKLEMACTAYSRVANYATSDL